MTIADLVNAPSEITFEGQTYRLSPPSLLQQGEFQRYLEQKVLDGINRRQYPDEKARERDRANFNDRSGAGYYEWGGEYAAHAAIQPAGYVKLLAIIGREQGLTLAIAERLVKQKLHESLAAIMSRIVSDPKELGAILTMLGLPADILSSPSPTHPSTSESTTLPASPTTSSSGSTEHTSAPPRATPN